MCMKLRLFLLLSMQIVLIKCMDINDNTTASSVSAQVEALLKSLTPEQKIAQLFMPGMQLNDPQDFQNVIEIIKRYAVGGVLLTHSAPLAITTAYIDCLHDTNRVYEHPIPLWLSMDAEWGLSMRLTNAVCFPKAMTLAAIRNKELVYACGKEIGRQVKALGVHINFAPVVDVNNNAENPVIGMRSFGQDAHRVTECAQAYLQGLTDAGIVGCAKHFPGHGDTYVDSHVALPVIVHSVKRLQEVEQVPFKALIQRGAPMVMVAHLLIPALDKNVPTSLSSSTVTDLLRKQLGFNGVVVTDGLKMKVVADEFTSAQLALKAFNAGNDIILQLEDTAAGINALVAAYNAGQITLQQIDERVTRILQAKEKYGLLQKDYRAETYKEENFHTPGAYDLQQRLYEAAMTLVNNDNKLVPIMADKSHTVLLTMGGNQSELVKLLKAEGIAHVAVHKDSTVENTMSLLAPYAKIIMSVAGTNKFAHEQYGVSKLAQTLCDKVQEKPNVLILFGIPYAAAHLAHQSLLVAYEDVPAAQKAAAKVLLGHYDPTGTLPVSISNRYPVGTGVLFCGTPVKDEVFPPVGSWA